MATGDILSATILATGWEAEIVIEGLDVGGTYDLGALDTSVANAKVDFTVVSEGYDASGTLGTKTRHVYGTRARMKAYPNQATAEEAVVDTTNVKVTLALSEYIYDDDKNGGAGTSGTDPIVTITSGFYTKTGVPNNAVTALAVTNSSTQDYPTVIARWAVVPYQRFTSTFDLECVAFHRFAENGNPVACLIFLGKEGASTIETITATAMVKSAQADSLPCYKGTLTASNYTDNAVVTCEFTAYPWVGDENSIRTSVGGTANALTLGPLPLVADPDDDYGVTYAVVDTTNGNDTTPTPAASSVLSEAEAAPFATINHALTHIAAYNNTTYGRNNAGAAIIYLKSNNHTWGAGTGSATTSDVWVTITRHPSVAKADACIIAASAGYVASQFVQIADCTIVPSGWLGYGVAGRVIWQDGVDIKAGSQLTTSVFTGYDLTYNTFCTADKMNYPWAQSSSGTVPALIRGCSATNVRGLTSSALVSVRTLLTTTLNHSGVDGAPVMGFSAANSIMAYCKSMAHNAGVASGVNDVQADDCACVCNIMEHISSSNAEIANTEANNARSASNKIYWHNTFAGERHLTGYNHASATPRSHANFSFKFNSDTWVTTKHDVFGTDGALTGGWCVLYGVGFMGNNSESAETNFRCNYFGIRSSWSTAAGYTDDNSRTTGAGETGNGNYMPAAGSVLLAKIPSAADIVIPWDITGAAYRSGGSAGAYEYSPARKYLMLLRHA